MILFTLGFVSGVICGAVVAVLVALSAASYLPKYPKYRPDEWDI